MFRIVFLSTFAAALLSASANSTNAGVAAVEVGTAASIAATVSSSISADLSKKSQLSTTEYDCKKEDQTHFFIALIGLTVLSLIFLVAIVISLVLYVGQIGTKMREAENNLFQVMDAVLRNSIPRSIVNEIALIAEEAQKKK
ncbi:hypothetical protein QR680_008629 [Steinernema hermaphroditum]|uniref:Nematode cuticle collagen N-terminal domain-containing protein n=1 Tax=Steinernema hermaphroditum TaxID=289476 RepID=A0AA39M8D7_9BILA|nr:hypothetical protein QR680_008629 [Steinernema hermaphroditum]